MLNIREFLNKLATITQVLESRSAVLGSHRNLEVQFWVPISETHWKYGKNLEVQFWVPF